MMPAMEDQGMMQGQAAKPGAMEGGPSPDDVKKQLIGVVKQLKQVAEQNDVDWNEVLDAAASGKGPGMGGAGPMPKMGMMGGGM